MCGIATNFIQFACALYKMSVENIKKNSVHILNLFLINRTQSFKIPNILDICQSVSVPGIQTLDLVVRSKN